MITSYAKIKVFPDGGMYLTIKDNPKQTKERTEKALVTKKLNEIERAANKVEIIKKLNKLTFLKEDRAKRERLLKELEPKINIADIKHSARRARQNLYDICLCNDFQYFVTFTYDKEKIDRYNDEKTRRAFSIWANNIRKIYPDMYYVAVCEYHEKGALHYHLLVGGIKWEDLKPEFWKLDKKTLAPIYTVGAWPWGYSTVSRIRNGEAAKHYICKYITKQHFDERFFNKRRFHTSHNIIRPTVYSAESVDGNIWEALNLDMWEVRYLHAGKNYGVFYTDGNGVMNTEYNDEGTRERIKAIAEAGKLARDRFTRRAQVARPCPHLTIRTLNSKIAELNSKIEKTTDYYLDY